MFRFMVKNSKLQVLGSPTVNPAVYLENRKGIAYKRDDGFLM